MIQYKAKVSSFEYSISMLPEGKYKNCCECERMNKDRK